MGPGPSGQSFGTNICGSVDVVTPIEQTHNEHWRESSVPVDGKMISPVESSSPSVRGES